MREIDVKPNSIILEPIGKSTAPSIVLAALQSLDSNKDFYKPKKLIKRSNNKLIPLKNRRTKQ